MKKFVLAVVTACTVAGCSTYESIKDRPVSIEVSSNKSADEYIGCIAPAFIQLWPQSTTVQDGNSRVVTGRVQGTMSATVTVRAQGEGSTAEYRQINNLNVGNFKKARAAVADCR